MKTDFVIDNYKVILIINEDFLEDLWSLGCSSTLAFSIYKQSLETHYDFGFTYTNLHGSIIYISLWSSEGQLINTIAHESRHLLEYIAFKHGFLSNSEEVCYLLGKIVQIIYLKCKENNLF